MGERLRRLTAPLVISLAIHLGTVYGTYGVQSCSVKPISVTGQTVMHENIRGSLKPKGEALSRLKQQKQKYLTELLSSLRKGVHIKLSDFFIKSEVLDTNIRLAEKEEPGIEEAGMQHRYQELVAKARKAAAGKENPISALHDFVHEKVFAGYFWGSGKLTDVLTKGWYNCLSSSETFTALMEDALGETRHQTLVFDDHIASFMFGRMIENTDHYWKSANKDYDGCGLVAPKEIFIAAYLVKNGIPKEELPPHLSQFYRVRVAKPGCHTIGKKLVADLPEDSGFPNPGIKSGLSVPSYFLPNPRYKSDLDEIVKLGRALLAAYRIAHLDDPLDAMQLQSDGKTLFVSPLNLPEDSDWGRLLEMFKGDFHISTNLPLLHERTRRCLPYNSIPMRTIPDIISFLPPKIRLRFEDYTIQNLCKRYGVAIEHGTLEELKEYLPFYFCTDLSESLKKRYLREKNRDTLRLGLGDMAISENFDFFVNELKSDDLLIKRAATGALVLSDSQKGCQMLSQLPEDEKRKISTQLILGCNDSKTAWSAAERTMKTAAIGPGDHKPAEIAFYLEFIDGRMLDRTRYEYLKEIGGNVTTDSKGEIARILYEFGDKETAKRYYEEAIKSAATTNPLVSFWICGFPKEFDPLLDPILENLSFSIAIAEGLLSTGGRSAYPPVLIDSLRRFVNSKADAYHRVNAAFHLLLLGYDPLDIR